MTEKEIGELRRRMKPERTNITAVRGCYVSSSGDVLSSFRQSMGLMTEEDKEKYLAIFRKTLSGTVDRSLIDLPFRTAQVADSEEHRLLMRLRESALNDDEAVETLFSRIRGAYTSEDHYLILLAHENYDVPFKAKDGADLEDGSDVFSYVLCAVCPVKPSKEALRYVAEEKEFHNGSAGYAAAMPELGFLFPAFDGRRANIYDCLYYTRSVKDNHEALVQALFNITPPLAAQQQQESFSGLLRETLEEACSLPVVQAVREDLRQRIEVHKETKDDTPLTVSGAELRSVLADAGVPEEKQAQFSVQFESTFGTDAALSPRNLMESKKIQLKTPDVIINVAPDRADLIETRVIGGIKYILIKADDGVELSGVDLEIS